MLVCSVSIAPADCQTDTAIKTVHGPGAANEVECGLYGQAFFAEMGQFMLAPGEYLKIMCTRTSISKTVG